MRPVKTAWWGAGVVICLERGANLHMAQLMPLSLASVKSRLVLPFCYRLTWVVPEKGPLNVCVCVCMIVPETSVFWLLKTIAKIQWVVSCPVQVELGLVDHFLLYRRR